MKSIKKYAWLVTGLLLLFFGSCEEYLDKTPYAEVTDEDVFGTYEKFQGFVDQLYAEVPAPITHNIAGSFAGGGDVYGGHKGAGIYGPRGDYWKWISWDRQSTLFMVDQSQTSESAAFGDLNNKHSGVWPAGWRAIRTANLGLEKFNLMEGTQEEKDFLKGQMHFWRAYHHFEIIRSWGGMPYIDKVFEPGEPMSLPRLTYQECTEEIVKDLDIAIALLPVDWDQTVLGGQRLGANTGRITKGAAMAYKAKTLLYAGSPLMNGYSGKTFTYNKEYMEKAAAAAWEVLKLVNQGVYALVPFDERPLMWARNDATYPWTTETIYQKVQLAKGSGQMTSHHGRFFNGPRWGGNAITCAPNQAYIDRFEMADGTRYKVEYDNDNARRWDDRDPRFRQSVIVDRDKHGFHKSTVYESYLGGLDKGAGPGAFTPYCVKKYWPIGVNKYDKMWSNYKLVVPQMRLADVYLFYAEAVNEAYGADGSAPGASLSAMDAVNIIRTRAGMPPVTSAATGYDSFRELIWNERCVELAFEEHYWFDKRRWYIGHLPEYKPVIDLEFDKDWTAFNRVLIMNMYFEDPKHYWLPIPRDQTHLYHDFNQNPGW